MKSILAYGDSNTWGLIPGTYPDLKRYDEEIRWTRRLEKKLEDVRIIEEGLCGRTTVFEDALRPGRRGVSMLSAVAESHAPFDGAIIMLGTNDCKTVYGATAHTIGRGLELCLRVLERYLTPEKILVVSPILLGEEVWRPEKDPEFDLKSIETSKGLKAVYREVARRHGTAFLAASDYVGPDPEDDEHLNEEGHRILAEVLKKAIEENFTECFYEELVKKKAI